MARFSIEVLGDTVATSQFVAYPNDSDEKTSALFSGVYQDKNYMFVTPDGKLHSVPIADIDAEFDRLWEIETSPNDPTLDDIPDNGDGYPNPDDEDEEDGFPANEGEETVYRDTVDDEQAELAEDEKSGFVFSTLEESHTIIGKRKGFILGEILRKSIILPSDSLQHSPAEDVPEAVNKTVAVEDILKAVNIPAAENISKTDEAVTVTPVEIPQAAFDVPLADDLSGRVSIVEEELREMHALLKPEVAQSLEMIVNALADSVTHRSINVTRIFQRELSSMLKVYNTNNGPLVIGGLTVARDHYASWTEQEVSAIFARLCNDYWLSKDWIARTSPELDHLHKAIMAAADKDEASQRRIRDLERQIDKLRDMRDGGLSQDEAKDLQDSLDEAKRQVTTLTTKLAAFKTPLQPMFVLHCENAQGKSRGYVSINRDTYAITFTDTVTGPNGMTMFSSQAILENAMMLTAEWLVKEAEVNKTLHKSERGIEDLIMTPQMIVYRTGKTCRITRVDDGKIEVRPIEDAPVKITPTAAPIPLDIAAHMHKPEETKIEEFVDEFSHLDAPSPVNTRLAAAQRALRIESEDDLDVNISEPDTEGEDDMDMDAPVARARNLGHGLGRGMTRMARPLPEDEDEGEAEQEFTAPAPVKFVNRSFRKIATRVVGATRLHRR
jgi:hypothetical protein